MKIQSNLLLSLITLGTMALLSDSAISATNPDCEEAIAFPDPVELCSTAFARVYATYYEECRATGGFPSVNLNTLIVSEGLCYADICCKKPLITPSIN